MTNNSPLDEHIKKQFGDYTPDIPPHIWENIVAEREKRKPAGFWFGFMNKNVLFLLAVILLAGTSVIIYNNVHSTAVTATTDRSNSIKEQEKSIDKTTTGIPSTNDIGKTDKNKITENISAAENKPGEAGINDLAAKDQGIAGEDKTAGKNKFIVRAKSNSRVSIAGGDATASINTDKQTKNRSNKKTTNQKGSAVISLKDGELSSDDNETGTSTYDPSMNRMFLNLDMIRATKTFDLPVKNMNNPHADIPCPAAEKDAAGNKKYIEFYAGPDYAFRTIKDTGNSVYAQKRKESTTFSSAFSAGLRYTRVFGNGMSFRAGINYSQINEKFKFSEGNIIQVVYETNSNGDTTASFTTVGTRYKTTHNKFRTLDVPILVGYELGNGRWHANFNAGAVVNLYSWQKGDVLDTAYKPVSITTGKANSPYQFKTNVGIGFMGSVSVYYKLTGRMHIFAEPYFRYNFSAASKSDLTLKQKYNTAGLRLGIRIDF